jgi:hypothetical protein
VDRKVNDDSSNEIQALSHVEQAKAPRNEGLQRSNAGSRRKVLDLAKNWAWISSLTGAVLYVIGRLFTDTFYAKYGLTPEDLGIDLPYLVMRVLPLAAILGGLLVLLIFIGGLIGRFGVTPIIAAWLIGGWRRARAESIKKLRATIARMKSSKAISITAIVFVLGFIFSSIISFRSLRPEAQEGWFATISLGLGIGITVQGSLTFWGLLEDEKPPEAEKKQPYDVAEMGLLMAILGLILAGIGAVNLWKLPFETADLYAAQLDNGKPVELSLGQVWPVFRVESFRVTGIG